MQNFYTSSLAQPEDLFSRLCGICGWWMEQLETASRRHGWVLPWILRR